MANRIVDWLKGERSKVFHKGNVDQSLIELFTEIEISYLISLAILFFFNEKQSPPIQCRRAKVLTDL